MKIQYKGLTDAQVQESRAEHGSNVLTPPQHDSWLKKFIGSFNDPLICILLVAALLAFAVSFVQYYMDNEIGGEVFLEPAGILVAVLLATMVGFILERKNEKIFQSLNEVNDETLVKAVRNGNVHQVMRKDIVVGDVVILEAGEEVPADCELLESLDLLVNESTLTGEPQVRKTTKAELFNKEATYPSNNVLKGTTVIEGYCVARVTKVGDMTESGKVFEAAQVRDSGPTPLTRELKGLSKVITIGAYIIAGLVVVGRIAMYLRSNWNTLEIEESEYFPLINYCLETFMIAVALIAVAVPEGLPMSVTLSLAYSMRQMMKENTLPRTLHACETIGAASVICTDKTGTLTQNQMRVAEMHLADGVNDDVVCESIAVNSTANLDFYDVTHVKAVGNPTEGALLLWLNDIGRDYAMLRNAAEVVARVPFSTEKKYMSTTVRSAVTGQEVTYTKGAPEIVMSMCEMSADAKERYAALLEAFQTKAMRTLAFAADKCFLGVAAISDPVRSEVPEAIRECVRAGIDVKIVTGDVSGTAKEIGRQTGVWTDADDDSNMLTGAEFGNMTDEQLLERVGSIKILSRAKPDDKERLVRLLKRNGNVVAVTGDGTNDAPALNAADVGLSMGDGTAVAKEASDITILDNSFKSICNSVMWGRSLYKNIQRFITFQMTINVAACLVVLVGSFYGTDSPLSVTQMLWVNLIMDTFAALALASLPPSHIVMMDKPRNVKDSIFSKEMIRMVFGVGGAFALILLVLLYLFEYCEVKDSVLDLLHRSGRPQACLPAYELSLFFTIFVTMQFWNMFNIKAFMGGHQSAFKGISQCKGFVLIACVIFFGQILIVNFGGKMFNVMPIKLCDWLIIFAATSPVLVVGEVIRFVKRSIRRGS